jgi:hypothetical protein
MDLPSRRIREDERLQLRVSSAASTFVRFQVNPDHPTIVLPDAIT